MQERYVIVENIPTTTGISAPAWKSTAPHRLSVLWARVVWLQFGLQPLRQLMLRRELPQQIVAERSLLWTTRLPVVESHNPVEPHHLADVEAVAFGIELLQIELFAENLWHFVRLAAPQAHFGIVHPRKQIVRVKAQIFQNDGLCSLDVSHGREGHEQVIEDARHLRITQEGCHQLRSGCPRISPGELVESLQLCLGRA